MAYRVSSGESPHRPWTVIDAEAPAGFYVTDHMTAADAHARAAHLNLAGAAPDLLCACIAALSAIESGNAADLLDVRAALVAAIAKAKGE